ncbi:MULTISPECIES: Gfo/Idh/MocA family protein [Flavobacteriaceae]|uniref:Gfo/Idh/MocA family protein n=1 Tax=Flavobacteriaceae TaxID=49546 RepID=UPI0010AE294C|nr:MULTISPECIES: Gfo/Idh/MocA family oxidoreductase [Flavobacteriaceae]NJB35067.1 Gfo/Idh/MocA family oxidoreductase [Croceivirga sp. JEA036]TKD63399.1 Gfo/Idh/MocA family oxidoreductase [Flavobacterium sp. ASW18X]
MSKQNSRRSFVKKTTLGTIGLASASSMGMSAQSYKNIMGANDRLHVAIAGLGRRLGAYYAPIAHKDSNVRLTYLCDAKQSQMTKAAEKFAEHIKYKPTLEQDIFKVLDDDKVDVLINAMPDHWHTPGAIMAMKAGKHVYVEKPSSCTMEENELLVAATKKYGKIVQMGNQQRSSGHTQQIIQKIHEGTIGEAYKAIAFYSNGRGEVPNQQKAAVPEGLDWNLWQGPAVHREYTSETWNYNWHWYGWNYATAEMGNNATHELDVARWALNVDLPQLVEVESDKRHFKDDGWEMYDTMLARFTFEGNKQIEWDGKSRNAYNTYGSGRGVIIYGTEGTVFVNRGHYRLFDRKGQLVEEVSSGGEEGGVALGGGGDMSTLHVQNFFDAIRGKTKLYAPIEDANISMAMVHYANVSSRIKQNFEVDDIKGTMFNRDAMNHWGKPYEESWKSKFLTL